MHHRDRQCTHARFVLHIKDRTIHIVTIRVWSVEDDKLLTFVCTCVHEAKHRNIIGIETQSYILDVGDKHIKSGHCFFRRTVTLTIIERQNRYACLLIYATCYVFALACSTTETMLRREDSSDIHTMLE